MALAWAAPFREADLLAEIRTAAPYRWIDAAIFGRLLGFVRDGGYALKSYDRFRRLAPDGHGGWRISHPQLAAQHRLNAGIIVEAPMADVRSEEHTSELQSLMRISYAVFCLKTKTQQQPRLAK